MRKIISKELNEKDIPQPMLNAVSPAPVKALYMREECAQPENTVVEIWSLDDNTFAMFQGDFDGNWDKDNVELVGTYPNLDKAKFAATATYTFANATSGPDYTGDDLVDGRPGEQDEDQGDGSNKAASVRIQRLKRLAKK